MEEEAEKLYRDERPSLVEDEAAATRDMMYVSLMITLKTQRPTLKGLIPHCTLRFNIFKRVLGTFHIGGGRGGVTFNNWRTK